MIIKTVHLSEPSINFLLANATINQGEEGYTPIEWSWVIDDKVLAFYCHDRDNLSKRLYIGYLETKLSRSDLNSRLRARNEYHIDAFKPTRCFNTLMRDVVSLYSSEMELDINFKDHNISWIDKDNNHKEIFFKSINDLSKEISIAIISHIHGDEVIIPDEYLDDFLQPY